MPFLGKMYTLLEVHVNVHSGVKGLACVAGVNGEGVVERERGRKMGD